MWKKCKNESGSKSNTYLKQEKNLKENEIIINEWSTKSGRQTMKMKRETKKKVKIMEHKKEK